MDSTIIILVFILSISSLNEVIGYNDVFSFKDWKILLCGTIRPSDEPFSTLSIETSCPIHFQPFLWIGNKNATPESPRAHTGSCLSTGGK